MADPVLREYRDGVVTLTLNRPEARNALSLELIDALAAALEDVAGDGAKVLVLAGTGPAFCAGMDLKGVMSDPVGMRAMLHGLAGVTRQLRALSIPTIARVQGAAIGGGCGLMVVPDFAVTHADAKIGYPEVGLGLCPAVVAPWLLRRIGSGRARAMLLGGQLVSGQTAFELGLASHLVDVDDLPRNTAELARGLAEGSARALETTKRWLNELEGELDEAVLARGADLSADILAGEEAQARLRARFSGG